MDGIKQNVMTAREGGGCELPVGGLKTLADEYCLTADKISARLPVLKERLKTARGTEAFLLEKRILLLKQELGETRRIMSYLSGYYSADSKRRGWGFM